MTKHKTRETTIPAAVDFQKILSLAASASAGAAVGPALEIIKELCRARLGLKGRK